MAVDTRPRGVMPTTRAAMSTTLTGSTDHIQHHNPNYFPLAFPLLFPHGEVSGWHPDLCSTSGERLTLMQWVTQLLVREDRFSQLGPLTNEFLIDAFSCIEDDRLMFHARNQDKYRTSCFQQLNTPRENTATPSRIIQDRIIIPSSFKNGFTDKAKKLTEAMAILRHFSGSPSYFITATCNQVNITAGLHLPTYT